MSASPEWYSYIIQAKSLLPKDEEWAQEIGMEECHRWRSLSEYRTQDQARDSVRIWREDYPHHDFRIVEIRKDARVVEILLRKGNHDAECISSDLRD